LLNALPVLQDCDTRIYAHVDKYRLRINALTLDAQDACKRGTAPSSGGKE